MIIISTNVPGVKYSCLLMEVRNITNKVFYLKKKSASYLASRLKDQITGNIGVRK